MTGEGVVLPGEDVVEVERRMHALHDQMKPRTEAGDYLVRRIAILSLRVERCVEQETGSLAARVIEARDNFDDNRFDQAEALYQSLAHNPSSTIRKLKRTPEGAQLLLAGWNVLKSDLERGFWTPSHGQSLAHLQGSKADDCHAAYLIELSESIRGRFDTSKFIQDGQITPATRVGWARTEVLAIIDRSITSLTELADSFDPDDIERERMWAMNRAKFDPSPEAILARKYEANAERNLFRSLREARIVEAEPELVQQNQAAGSRASATKQDLGLASRSLASSFPAQARAMTEPSAKVLEPFDPRAKQEIEWDNECIRLANLAQNPPIDPSDTTVRPELRVG